MQPEVEKKSLTAKFYIKIFSQRLRLQPELLFLSTPAWLTPVDHSLSAGTREVSQPAPRQMIRVICNFFLLTFNNIIVSHDELNINI